MLTSDEQFDLALEQHAPRLIVLEASLTWCRPCKGFERTYQARPPPALAPRAGWRLGPGRRARLQDAAWTRAVL